MAKAQVKVAPRYFAYAVKNDRTMVCVAEGSNYDKVKQFFENMQNEYQKITGDWPGGFILSHRDKNHVTAPFIFD